MPNVQEFAAVLGLPFLACVLMTMVLGYLGLHVLRRDIVFVDIAMAQIVAVGAIGAHLLFDAEHESALAYLCAFGLAVVAAAFYASTRRRVLDISTEAVIGVSYAIAAAAALFLLGVAPGGHVHAQHMLAGSLLWASRNDLLASGAAFLAVGICFFLLRRPFERISDDYRGAIRDGVRVVWWDFLFYTLIGVVITFAVRTGGVVVVFCLLIIPASVAVLFSSRLLPRLVLAWAVGIAGSLLGLLFAQRLDFSVGPSVALWLGIMLVVAGSWHRLKPVPSTAITVAVALGFLALLGITPAREREGSTQPGEREGVAASGSSREEAGPDTGALALLPEAVDWPSRCEAVLERIDRDPTTGVEAALELLEDDPPPFFRQQVTDRLNEAVGGTFEFDPTLPFSDPANREAVRRLREDQGAR